MKKSIHCLATIALGLLLSGVFSGSAFSQEEEPSPAQKAYTEGREAYYAGLFDEAIEHFRTAVSLAPDEALYGVALGKAYSAGGKTDEAQQQFERIVRDHPTNVEAGKELAAIYARQEEWQKVLDLLTDLLPYKHDYAMFKYLADAANNLRKTTEAKEYYREALKFNEGAALDHYQLADIYLTESKFRLAASGYARALELGYEDALIHYKLGTAYFNLRNFLGQVEVREIPGGVAGEISDDFFLIEALPGSTHLFYGAPVHSAVYQVKKGMDMGIEVVEARLLLANTYFHTRRLTRAIELFLEIEGQIKEEDQQLFYSYLGQAYFLAGRYDEYLDAVRKATAEDAEALKQALVEAHHSIALKHEQMGDTDNQINYLLRCIEAAPTNAQFHLELGDAYYRQKAYPEAAAQWKMALDLQPDHPEQMRIINLINQLTREGKL